MIKLDKFEVLRYLGYKDQIIDNEMDNLINRVIKDVEKTSYKYIYKKFDIVKKNNIRVLSTNIEFKGVSINNILKYSDEIIIFAATLGQEVDKQINKLKYKNLTEMLILDACASEMIEKILDKLEEEIKIDGFHLAPRYSPGYGDLSLDYQKDILKILDATKKIGLMVSESSILLPKKSVTGIIGIQNTNRKVDYRPCDDCLARLSCDFTKCTKGGINEF